MKVLVITSEWPSPEYPYAVPFLINHIDQLRAAGVEVEVFHFRGRQNPVNYLKAWFKLRQHPFWKEADLLHAHWGQSALLSIFSHKKLVITFHGSDLFGIPDKQGNYTLKGKILTRASRWMSRKASANIVVSARLQEKIPATLKNVSVIPIGLDLEKFHQMDSKACKAQLNFDENEKHALFIGDITRNEKRYWLAKAAVEAYNADHKDSRLSLINLVGVEHDQMPVYLNASDVLLLTSSHEGSSTVIKEALACGLPVVSSDVGDASERLGCVVGCSVCYSDSPDEYAEAISVALNHGKPVKLTEESIKQIDERNNIKELISIYKRVLNER
ncbi:MAG: glycosyltransferase family 4 protein [Clostridiales bacterium]|nr:glycosyltransferase family 4 protein [Clostridiales bacterium]